MSSVPVSQYEALRAEMRSLVQQAQQVQEIATQIISTTSAATSLVASQSSSSCTVPTLQTVSVGSNQIRNDNPGLCVRHITMEQQGNPENNQTHNTSRHIDFTGVINGHGNEDALTNNDEFTRISSSTHLSVSSEPTSNANRTSNSLYHGTWPVERMMWNSEPPKLNPDSTSSSSSTKNNMMDQVSVLSFASSSGGAPLDRVLSSPDRLSRRSMQQLEAKVDMVYSLLAMLGGQEHADMGDTLLALSTSPESCMAMKQSGCIPLLVQLVQSDKDLETRKKASQALCNLVQSQPDEKIKKRETRILKLLEQIRSYTEALVNNKMQEYINSSENEVNDENDTHPVPIIANLMKHSFDEGHRQAICQFGGIHTIATLVDVEHNLHGNIVDAQGCILLRRYACMALTNLTFGDSGNKTLLCSFREFMRALVIQLQSPSDELRQVTASVLRNLSWRADQTSKEILRDVGTVAGLMKAGMATVKENTLKSILSALWNLSAHCTENKLEICAVEGGLRFLVDMLSYKAPSKSLTINENAGGILRNISSQIAVRDDYREILRKHNCLQVLLEQLKSPSLTIVSNACGTLWNLSAKNQVDQEALWQMGAPAMLRSLNHSKHKMIATGSSAALKNLLNSRPTHTLFPQMDSTAKAMELPALPTLGVRKQKALLRDLDQNLSETLDNIDDGLNSRNNDDAISLEVCTQKRGTKSKQFLSQDTEYSSNEKHGATAKIKHDSALCNDFSNLTLTDSPHTYEKEYRSSKIGKSLYGSSAANMSRRKDTFIPIRSGHSSISNYGIYTETDLDQPTDYSLMYAEDDSDSDICEKDKHTEEFVQDSVKTYYTEGTPLNFSTATSMSDLRIDIDNDKSKEKSRKDPKISALSHLDEKDSCSVEDISDIDNTQKGTDKIIVSQLSSGLMSPEIPVNYCEEGTPGYFSRVSSFGSLNNLPCNESVLKTVEEDKNSEKDAAAVTEAKTVKIVEPTINCAEQTPLMFSRSSSLGSLGSVEQHSIHDDRSSVISDFSRLTSGIVSPSELPDSPTQTVPPSPKPRKSHLEYSRGGACSSRNDIKPQPAPRTIQKPSVFEDNVTRFKEESTPVQFSATTSISSLTIDDEPKQLTDASTSVLTNDSSEKCDVNHEKVESSSENEEEENILADCINIGMQNNRHRQTNNSPQSKVSSVSYKPTVRPQGSGIPLPRSSLPIKLRAKSPVTPSDTSSPYSKSPLQPKEENVPTLSRQESLSSLSVESLGSLEIEQALLEQCISSGMPKSKQPAKINEKEKPVGVATKQFNVAKTNEIDRQRMYFEKENGSKNVNAASVVGNISVGGLENPQAVTDGSFGNLGPDKVAESKKRMQGSPPAEKSLWQAQEKNGYEKDNMVVSNNSDFGGLSHKVDNRMLDPDAMIESLDRFTAELVSQASSHFMQKDDNKFVASVTEGDTWNEDISPNDVTFPSISGSAPNVVTFDSEKDKPQNNDEQGEHGSNDFSSINTSTMTESTLIAMEATKMATTFKQEAELSSVNSVTSLELDQIQPPSQMNSLTSSAVEIKNSPRSTRKRSLPVNLMVRKILSSSLNQGSSLESLENHSVSNLDQINPPSAMGDVDMEGSMISVASLKSEIAELQSSPKITTEKEVQNIKSPPLFVPQMSNSIAMNSISDLDHINPPSLFNEVTDLCNSLADVTNEQIETDVCDYATAVTDNDITEFSDANSVTPIQTDPSSAESTPKRVRSLNKHLTPKQRRQLAKERYKTYTVAAGMLAMKSDTSRDDDDSVTEDYKTAGCDSEPCVTATEGFSTATFSRNSRRTAKERRQMDQSRFQTQVLDKNVFEAWEASQNSSNLSNGYCTASSDSPQLNTGDIHYLVHKEANVVLKTLVETKSRTDDLLECETLSLVSNEDDSEHNCGSSISYRTYHKSWGKPSSLATTSHNPVDVENQRPNQDTHSSGASDNEEDIQPAKPKINKPSERVETIEYEGKGIRGRRKPLYSKSNLTNKAVTRSPKLQKPLVANLAKNVTSSNLLKQKKQITSRPPVPQTKGLKAPMVYNKTPPKPPSQVTNDPKRSPNRNINNTNIPPPLERQGTFTKEDLKAPKSRIPSAIPKMEFTSRAVKSAPASKLPSRVPSATSNRSGVVKSMSADRANKPTTNYIYNRSSSMDSREKSLKSNIPNPSTKRGTPEQPQRSNSNSSLATHSNSKQITSRIANLWKKVEENKKQQPVKDTRVWIQARKSESPSKTSDNSYRSTLENKQNLLVTETVHSNEPNPSIVGESKDDCSADSF